VKKSACPLILPTSNIADGLRTNVGAPNFPIIQHYVDDIANVREEAIVSAMRTILGDYEDHHRTSAAVPYGAILERQPSRGCGLASKVDIGPQASRHHSHRRQCRSRRFPMEPVAVVVSAATSPTKDAAASF
jgi:threonine dehydratase